MRVHALLSRARLLSFVLLGAAAACTDLPTGANPTTENQMRGIDVSHWQGAVDWRAVEASGVAFAFVKATEGATYTDPRFADNWRQLAGTRIVRGAYHFFRPGTDAAQQAAQFLRTVPLGASDLPPVLDVEVTDGVDDATLARGVRAWLEIVERETGKRPILYTRRSFWDAHALSGFGAYPLWVAHYGVSDPWIPASWPAWTFWQHSDAGRVPGIAGPVDLDVFNGSEAELRRFVQSGGRTTVAPVLRPLG